MPAMTLERPLDIGNVALRCHQGPPGRKARKALSLLLQGGDLLVVDGQGCMVLSLGPAALAAPFERALDKGSDQLAHALGWLADAQLATVRLAGIENQAQGYASVLLSVAFLPGVYAATAVSEETSASVAVVLQPFLEAAQKARVQQRQARLDVHQGAAEMGPAAAAGGPGPGGLGGMAVDGEGAGQAPLEGGDEGQEEACEGLDLPEPGALRDELYRMVLPSDWQREEPEPPGLRCQLYRFQRRALSWMLWRESFSGAGAAAGADPDPDSAKARLQEASLAWQRVPLPSGADVYWDALEGRLSLAPQGPRMTDVPGGLLCDEMGLGKTVEIIALILANPAPPRSPLAGPPAEAPAASVAGAPWAPAAPAPVASAAVGGAGDGGTLVICPGTLLQQWRAELANHAHGSLTVEVYDGLTALRPPDTSRKKPAQREMELYERMLSGDAGCPVFDTEREAAQAAERLRGADVVLTTFDVLQREVYYSPNERASGLRHAKRYAIPTCPLLQVNWYRLVCDEAQLVGPMSASGTMVERLRATHRWCVSGTPITSHGLADVRGLLHVLQHQPLASPHAFNLLFANPYWQGDPACWPVLRALLRPLMWRNTKAEVADEYSLPPRSLLVSHLDFQSGEREVYQQILEGMRATRDELLLQEVEEREAGGGHAAATPGSPAVAGSSAAAAGRKRRRGEKLREDAANRLLQLRLACIHPQLTKHWQQLSTDLQLDVGGTLSMEEIMQRLVDRAQHELQDVERTLCAHLNTLAMVLLSAACKDGKAGGAAAAAGDGDADPPEAEPGTSAQASKKRRKSILPLQEAQQEALRLLEQSYRVGEKGIDGMDRSMDQISGLEDITAGGATVVAWRRLQVNTEHQLARLYQALGMGEAAERMQADAKEKSQNVREHADLELAQAQARLEALQRQAEEARASILSGWQEAARLRFPVGNWGVTCSVEEWLQALDAAYKQAQQAEEDERERQAGNVKHILGEQVHKALGEMEKQIQAEAGMLERYVDSAHLDEGVEELHDAMRRISGATQGQLEAVCSLLNAQLRLLPAFRRRTLQAQWFWILPPEQLLEQQQQQQEQQQQQQQQLEGGGPPDASARHVDAGGGTTSAISQAGEAAQLRAARAAASSGAAYIAAPCFLGAVAGYAFKLGGQGVGYYADRPPETASLLTHDSVQQCAAQVLRALSEQQRKLDKQRTPEAATLDSCTMEGVQTKLASVQQQVHLLRLLKEAHVAECQVILRSAIQADVDADLAAAADEAPVSLTSPDALRKRIQQLRQEALVVRARKRYMSSRLQEAHQLAQQPRRAEEAAAAGEGGAGAAPGAPVGEDARPLPQGEGGVQPSGSTEQPGGNGSEAQQPQGGCAVAPEPTADGGHGPAVGQPPGELECPVCLRSIREDIFVFGACGHSYCKDCSPKLVLERGECAVCRTKVTAKQVYRVAAAGGGPASVEHCDPDAGEAAQEHVVGAWSIKVAAVLRRILAVTKSRPEEKCLVFSQFPDALKLLGRALDVNGVRYVQLAGNKKAVREAIKSFGEDAEIRVFLLSHRAGATGLTLVRANHVFLLEPALEPAIEQQAIARVHRIGQQRPVIIHRLLVRNSIEREVVKIQESKHALLAGESSDSVTTVANPVKNEGMVWGEAQALLDALL